MSQNKIPFQEFFQEIFQETFFSCESGPSTVRFGNCFLRVPLMYQPCCLVPCCQGKLGELANNSLQNLLYTSFCLLVKYLRRMRLQGRSKRALRLGEPNLI